MDFYQNLFHDIAFYVQKPGTSMLGVNLSFLDIFEIIRKYEYEFQIQTSVDMYATYSAKHLNHHVEMRHLRVYIIEIATI